MRDPRTAALPALARGAITSVALAATLSAVHVAASLSAGTRFAPAWFAVFALAAVSGAAGFAALRAIEAAARRRPATWRRDVATLVAAGIAGALGLALVAVQVAYVAGLHLTHSLEAMRSVLRFLEVVSWNPAYFATTLGVAAVPLAVLTLARVHRLRGLRETGAVLAGTLVIGAPGALLWLARPHVYLFDAGVRLVHPPAHAPEGVSRVVTIKPVPCFVAILLAAAVLPLLARLSERLVARISA